MTAGGPQWPQVERRRQGWTRDWQSTVERDKATLARLLHDETGGLLVAAVMDITAAEKQLADRPSARAQLARARSALDEAIEINRRVIEELRPTLLENFGLIAALKWHFAEVCKAAHIECRHQFPDESQEYRPPAAIALYRMAETMLSVLVQHGPVALELQLTIKNERLTLRAAGVHIATPFDRNEYETADALASVRGRVVALDGEIRIEDNAAELVIECAIPLSVVAESRR